MSEYLDEEEELARLKSWWDENGNTVIVAVIVAVVGIGGFNWYSSYSGEQAEEGTRAYTTYSEAVGVDEQSVALAQLEQNFSGDAVHVLALFNEAKRVTEEGDFAAAKTLLTEVVDAADDDLMVDLALIRLAKIERQLGESDAALATLSKVRNEGFRSWALEAQGDIYSAAGDVAAAHAAYQAATEDLGPGDERPFLAMKLENTAPFDGEFVELTDDLTEALDAARSTLEAAADAAVSEGESMAETGETETADTAEEVESPVIENEEGTP